MHNSTDYVIKQLVHAFSCALSSYGARGKFGERSYASFLLSKLPACSSYGFETVVSVLFSNTRTRLLYNEREIFNTAPSEAECSIENFEFIVQ